MKFLVVLSIFLFLGQIRANPIEANETSRFTEREEFQIIAIEEWAKFLNTQLRQFYAETLPLIVKDIEALPSIPASLRTLENVLKESIKITSNLPREINHKFLDQAFAMMDNSKDFREALKKDPDVEEVAKQLEGTALKHNLLSYAMRLERMMLRFALELRERFEGQRTLNNVVADWFANNRELVLEAGSLFVELVDELKNDPKEGSLQLNYKQIR